MSARWHARLTIFNPLTFSFSFSVIMENGASFNHYPNQEDKSGKPTYAAAAARNSSTVDPRSVQVSSGARTPTVLQVIFNRFLQIFRRS